MKEILKNFAEKCAEDFSKYNGLTELTKIEINNVGAKLHNIITQNKIDTLKTCDGHQQTGTRLNKAYFVQNISLLEKEMIDE